MTLQYKGITKKVYDEYKKLSETSDVPKNFIWNIYNYVAEQLNFKEGYEPEEIKHFFKFIYDELQPDYYQDEEYYTKYQDIDEYEQWLFENMTDKQEENIIEHRYNDNKHGDNEGITTDLEQFKDIVNKLLPDDEESNDNTDMENEVKSTRTTHHVEIQTLLEQLETGKLPKNTTKEQIKSQLIDLLEQEEQFFTVDFPDETTEDGTKSKYYYIDPDTNSYKRNTKARLKQLFNDKYGVKLHKNKNFFYDLLERVYSYREERKDMVEMENVFINRMTYEIIEKTKDDRVFTTDRLTYTTHDTNQVRLFQYTPGIRLDDVLNGDIEMSYPMKRIYEIFVPKTKPEETDKLRLFMQYLGMMTTGRNPAKLLLLLYDLEDEHMGNKGRTTLFFILRLCFQDTFIQLRKSVFKDQHKMNTLIHGKHGAYMDETSKDILTSNNTELKELVNGSGTSGSAMYTREQIKIESLPLLIGSNGLPDPTHDTAMLSRVLPVELPNQFVDPKNVREDTNTYPKISTVDNMIQQHIHELGQVISIGLNEFKALDLTQSLDGQLAIPPNLDRTIQVLSQHNVVWGLLQSYTEPVAVGQRIKHDWITTNDILLTIGKAYKRATGHDMDTNEVDNKKIGTLLRQIYPQFMTNPNNKKKSGGKTYYNLRLKTHQELQEEQNNIIEVFPLGELILYDLEKTVYDKIQNGVNTVRLLYEELDEEPRIIDETLEELNRKGVVDLTETQRLPTK
jgi:hypothetical protein